MKYKILIFSILIYNSLFSQTSQDSIFDLEKLYDAIRMYHPIAKQAALIPESAKANMMRARGAFDPFFYTYADQKKYKGKNYYSLVEGGFKMPTWWGIEGKVAYENNGGDYLNGENTVPPNGLVVAGVTIPLAQGLLIDQRRTILKQAEVFQQSAEWEQIDMMNDLFYQAAAQYWGWVQAYNNAFILQNTYKNAYTRFLQVKEYVRLGDRAAIDTVEAFLQVQNRQYELNETLLQEKNARVLLSNFLWGENNVPLELTEKWKPELPAQDAAYLPKIDSLQMLKNIAAEFHPAVQLYQFKIKQLDLERAWKQEKLKPKVNLTYNILTQEVGKFPPIYGNTFTQNFKWGLSVGFPILLRNERGDLQMTKIKMADARYALTQKIREIENKMQAYYNESQNLYNQSLLYKDINTNYLRLLQAEEVRFSEGESSLFLINSRETKWIEAQSKLLEVRCKYYKSLAALAYTAGSLR